MDSQNPGNKNNFFGYLPFHHLKRWKVNVSWDKRQVPFHIKMTCEQQQKRNVQFTKAPRQTKRPCPHISFSLLFSQATGKKKKKKTPLATGNIGIFFSSEVHFWNVSLFNFYKVRGPQTLTNELHYTQGSTYLLWQSVSLEEWYLHMRGKKNPESRFLSCFLVSVTLVHKSSQNFRSGRKLGPLKMRKQKPRAEITRPLTCPGVDKAAFLLAGVKGAENSTGFEIKRNARSNEAQSPICDWISG